MQDADDHFWTTDPDLFSALPGGPEVIAWFGFAPSFHDASLAGLEIVKGAATLKVEAFRMTDQTDENGYFLLDRRALIAIDLVGVSGLSLSGDATATIFELGIRRVTSPPTSWTTCPGPAVGDFEVKIESAYGLEGSIFARKVSLRLIPGVSA